MARTRPGPLRLRQPLGNARRQPRLLQPDRAAAHRDRHRPLRQARRPRPSRIRLYGIYQAGDRSAIWRGPATARRYLLLHRPRRHTRHPARRSEPSRRIDLRAHQHMVVAERDPGRRPAGSRRRPLHGLVTGRVEPGSGIVRIEIESADGQSCAPRLATTHSSPNFRTRRAPARAGSDSRRPIHGRRIRHARQRGGFSAGARLEVEPEHLVPETQASSADDSLIGTDRRSVRHRCGTGTCLPVGVVISGG